MASRAARQGRFYQRPNKREGQATRETKDFGNNARSYLSWDLNARATGMKNIVLVLLCACVFLAPDRAQSQEPDKAAELKSVLQEWQKRRESTESVLYEVIGKATVVKGYLSSDPSGPKMKGPVPAADYPFPLKIQWLLNFRKNCVRNEAF